VPAETGNTGSFAMESSSRSQNILERIVEARRASVAHRKRVLPEVALKRKLRRRAISQARSREPAKSMLFQN
jgi:hypothetical protein